MAMEINLHEMLFWLAGTSRCRLLEKHMVHIPRGQHCKVYVPAWAGHPLWRGLLFLRDLSKISSWTTVRTFSQVHSFFAWKPACWESALRDFSTHFSPLVLTQEITGYVADRTCFFQLTHLKVSPWCQGTAGPCEDSDPVLTHSSRRW